MSLVMHNIELNKTSKGQKSINFFHSIMGIIYLVEVKELNKTIQKTFTDEQSARTYYNQF